MQNSGREVVLLHGFYISYILILSIASIVDFFMGKYFDTVTEIIFLCICVGIAIYHYSTGETRLPAYAAIWIGATNLFVLLYNNGFSNHVIIFAVLLPLAPFFLLPLKKALIQTALYLLMLLSLMFISYMTTGSNELLHNTSALINLAYAVFFIISFGFFYHISVENSYRRIQHADRQKEILLKEVHHRVKNNLNMIASMLGLQANMYNHEIRSQLLNSKGRIEAIAMVHEMLYRSNNFAEIDFKIYVDKLARLIGSLHGSDTNILVSTKADITLPLETMLQIGMIVSELLSNSYKYAFEPDQAGHIDISLLRMEDRYMLRYHDSGKGYEKVDDLFYGRSLGLKLIRLAVRQLEGNMNISNNGGLTYQIEFSHE